jgi:transcriptional regulator with XRE-family HTH domain
MTNAEFRKAREYLGLSLRAMAVALRVSSEKTIRRWEELDPNKPTRRVPGPVAELVEHWLDSPECAPERSPGYR